MASLFSAHVTYRMLRRANLIIDAVKEAKLIDNIFHIQKVILSLPSILYYVIFGS